MGIAIENLMKLGKEKSPEQAKWAMLDEQYLKIVKAYNKDKFVEFFYKIKLITNFKKMINSNND